MLVRTIFCKTSVPLFVMVSALLLFPTTNLSGNDDAPKPFTAQDLAVKIKPSLVTISTKGRDGVYQGVGTGFIINADGLIATNLHVIGESRDFRVTDATGKQLTVTSIHASDRMMDLAIIRVDQTQLIPLALGDLTDLPQGAPIVVMGNPHGLQNSIVSGINSGIRTIGGRKMMHLAIPIEPGNSGGPVVDMYGKVHGIVTMKSVVTANLGFAVNVTPLKMLLNTPNPVALEKWLALGQVNPELWEVLHGARWKQRGGRIEVTGAGAGFAGRSICLSNTPLPEIPFEIQVRVKLSAEQGAAGIAFHADGNNKHYGFYPTNNKIRFTRFDGSSVFNWTVLFDKPIAVYQPGEFNTLRVRIEKERILLYLNHELILESRDQGLTKGKVGLVKFRDTDAIFRDFEIAKTITTSKLSSADQAAITAVVDSLPPLADLQKEDLAALIAHADAARVIIRNQSQQLQQKLDEFKKITDDIHVESVAQQLKRLLTSYDKQLAAAENEHVSFDIVHGALLIALVDQQEIDVTAYRNQVRRMGQEIANKLEDESTPSEILASVNSYLFTDNGFHGSRFDYDHPANSYLNRVLDDHEGLPITLSVIYIALGRQLGLDIYGVGIPGHFIAAYRASNETIYVDPFNEGKILTLDDVKQLATNNMPADFQEQFITPVLPRQLLTRILTNLLILAQDDQDKPRMLRYLELLVTIDTGHIQNRGLRAIIRYETGRRQAAVNDLDWFLEHRPAELDLDQIQRMRDLFTRPTR